MAKEKGRKENGKARTVVEELAPIDMCQKS